MPSAQALRWSGGVWVQRGGNWTQAASQQGGGGKEALQTWAGWTDWTRKLPSQHKVKAKAKAGVWVDYGEFPYYSPPWPPQANSGEAKEEAAAQAVLIRQALSSLSGHTCFDNTRADLQLQLAAAEKASIDKRTSTQKLLSAELYVQREQKRVDGQRAKLAELTSWIDQHQDALDKEFENIAKMRANIGAETEPPQEADVSATMDTDQQELSALEAKELEMRRKRCGANLTEEQRQIFDLEAEHFLRLVGQKRRQIQHELETSFAQA
jgi:hypothetical protein